jgi:putative oxygen-independent coproporphyrinogen III oxidase
VTRAAVGPDPTEPFGVYLHIPFCAHRCDYCSFAAWDDRHDLVGRYLEALDAELGRWLDSLPGPVTSVFVGGGTPSQVPAPALAGVLSRIPLAAGAEVTVEVNPEDATPELFEAWVAGGVNRVSFGVQSVVPHVLESLGRRHRPEVVPGAVAAARAAGMETFNVDIIYGAAGETVSDWRRTVEGVLELDPPHVSAYALTVEPGTPLAAEPHRHPDDDHQAACYQLVDDLLGQAGLSWYEISNWARPGHECRHNQLYWSGGDYVGIGCSAHSHRAGRRWWNVRTPDRYADLALGGGDVTAGSERLDADARRIEGLQLAVRTLGGVPAGALSDDDVSGVLDGLLEQRGERLVLTRRGRLLANEVALRLR